MKIRKLIFTATLAAVGMLWVPITTNASQLSYFYSATGTLVNAQDSNGNMSSYLTRDMRFDGTKPTYAVSNQKDVTALLDATGTVTKKYNYTSYGVPTAYSDPSFKAASDAISIAHNPYTYSNYYTDDESQNYYLNARYYNPTLGIFLTSDSYNLPNRYAYVNGNPVMGVDPTGHVSWYKFLSNHCEIAGGNKKKYKHDNIKMKKLLIQALFPEYAKLVEGSKDDNVNFRMQPDGRVEVNGYFTIKDEDKDKDKDKQQRVRTVLIQERFVDRLAVAGIKVIVPSEKKLSDLIRGGTRSYNKKHIGDEADQNEPRQEDVLADHNEQGNQEPQEEGTNVNLEEIRKKVKIEEGSGENNSNVIIHQQGQVANQQLFNNPQTQQQVFIIYTHGPFYHPYQGPFGYQPYQGQGPFGYQQWYPHK